MDAGVASYVTYIALLESSYEDSVRAWHELQFEIARKAIAEGRWAQIYRLSLVTSWDALEASTPGLALAEAYVVVSYLVEQYGLEKCIAIYRAANKLETAEGALVSEIGLTFGQLEVAIYAWLEETSLP